MNTDASSTAPPDSSPGSSPGSSSDLSPRFPPGPQADAARDAIRAARREDVPAVVGLIRELAEYEKLAHLATATPPRLEAELFGPTPSCECLVAERDGAVVGFALFFHNFSTFLCRKGLYLEDLFVQPAARGSGLGRRLLQRLAQIAVERDCGRFEWAVLDWNLPAQAFYQRMGATMQPDWRLCRVTGEALSRLAAA